jgi:nicotinamide-nucleotide amidase
MEDRVPVIEIINTGTELLLGRVLNTHHQWLCRQLTRLGYEISRQMTVADTGPVIQQSVRESLTRADLVIVTGGLGPTSDDLTRDDIAKLLGLSLHMDGTVLAAIEGFYKTLDRPMPPTTRVQAMVPEGALVLANDAGTAPGLAIDVAPGTFRSDRRPSLLILLPGPPRELYPMFTGKALPVILKKFPLSAPFHSVTLKTACMGESAIEEMLGRSLDGLVAEGLEVGYCARTSEVEVRLGARGPKAVALVDRAVEIVRGKLPPCIFGTGEDRLEEVVVRMLTERRQTLATAESCTGGLVSHRLTNIPGASAVLMCGLVTYSNESKMRLLGVALETIETHGAVSEETARAMAEGARQRSGVDYAVALTGIAGPGGGSVEKPVGTVYIAVSSAKGTMVRHHMNRWDRETFKLAASQQALEMVRQTLLEEAV